MAAPFLPVEEKHGEDCTCPSAGRIVIELVAADRACPGDRNPHRGARTTAELGESDLTPEQRDHAHAFPYTTPAAPPGRMAISGSCDCGVTAEQYAKLYPGVSHELLAAIPTRESVSRGEHTANQYREYHGITAPHLGLAADEAAGRPHAFKTTKPTDEYGRATR